jgi:L-fuconolactonase
VNIDSHQHFWQSGPAAPAWLTASMAALQRDYLPAGLAPLLAANDIGGTVAVQARSTLAETEWLLSLADANPFILGVVGWADLASPSLRETLAHYARHPKLVGLRYVPDASDDHYLLHPDFRRGLSLLADFDLTFDLLLQPRHLPAALDLVKQFPKQRFVLDHAGQPPLQASSLAPWDHDLRALARQKHVCCKVTAAGWTNEPAAVTRVLDVVFHAFGPDRLMFGSDWPVSTLAATYSQVIARLQDYLHHLPADATAKVMGHTATAFYRLDTGTPK